MKVFLLNPETPHFQRRFVMRRNRIFPPISLAIIAQGLERSGHDIRLLDANARQLKNAQVVREISRFRPDLLIYSSDRHDAWQLPVPDHGYMKSFFKALEEEATGPRDTVIIGPHGTLFPEVLLEDLPSVRYLIRGEPEEKTLDFVEALEGGSPLAAAGLSYRDEGNKPVHNADPGFIQDLDALPLPAYHLLPMDLYRDNTAPKHRFGFLVTSRGCPMSCIFCSKSMYGSDFRTRSIDKVMEEVDLLVNRYRVGRIFFHDQIFLFKRKRIEVLLGRLIERRYALTWRCQTRLFTLDAEMLKRMKQAGCTEIHVGLESISSDVQKAVKKKDADIEKFQEIYEMGKEIGISIAPNMIIGLPNETPESVLESARYYHDRGFPFLANVAIPYPDTQLFDLGLQEGKIATRNWDGIVDAAGTAGNSLTTRELEEVLGEVDRLNRQLWFSHMTLKQKAMKVPGFLVRKVTGKMKSRIKGLLRPSMKR
jgi:radical SAM superfamily enzyme YgiQ (UPF0313 family)